MVSLGEPALPHASNMLNQVKVQRRTPSPATGCCGEILRDDSVTWMNVGRAQVMTDAEGRFRVEGLIPGLRVDANFLSEKSHQRWATLRQGPWGCPSGRIGVTRSVKGASKIPFTG